MDTPFLPTDVRQLPRVGLVLGTGGIKAMAGLALFEFLDEQKIPIDLMVGCSGGALVCATMGIGMTTLEARDLGMTRLTRDLFTSLDYRALAGMFSSRLGAFNIKSGVIKPEKWKAGLREYFGDRKIEQLRPRTLLQTTDVETGEGVVLTKGPLAEAVYASCAFFPAFPPAYIDGRYLGDGIYSAPVPVMEAIKRNMDVIIALDFKEKVTAEPNGFFSCFYRHIDNTMRTLTRSQMFLSIGLHHHEIVLIDVDFDHAINPWDVHELPNIVEAGKKAIELNKSRILSAIIGFSRSRSQIKPPAAGAEKSQESSPEQSPESTAPSESAARIRRTIAIGPPEE